METGTCRVAHFLLLDPHVFRMRAVRRVVASRDSRLGRARAGCSERLGRRCGNTLAVIRPPFTKLSQSAPGARWPLRSRVTEPAVCGPAGADFFAEVMNGT